MKDLEWVNILMNLGDKKMKLTVKKICKDSKNNPLIINNESLLNLAEDLINKKKLTSNQRGVLARTIYVHKNSYIYEYEKKYGKMKLVNCNDENTLNQINKFIDFIINSTLYN